jgi:hypothetical protein
MMIETSLAEIFSGDVPRIDTVSIFYGSASRVSSYAITVGGIHIVGDDYIVLNDWKFQSDIKKYSGLYGDAAFLTRTSDGFQIEWGFVSSRFQGRFPLKEWVTFRTDELPLDDLVSETVAWIKEAQANLDAGVVTMTKWINLLKLWAGVKDLNYLLVELGSEQETIS